MPQTGRKEPQEGNEKKERLRVGRALPEREARGGDETLRAGYHVIDSDTTST